MTPTPATPIATDDPRLTAWSLGETDELDADTCRTIAAAVARDPALAAEVAAIRAMDGALAGLLGEAPVAALDAAQRDAVLTPPGSGAVASVATLAPPERRSSRRRWYVAGAIIAAAAVALFVARSLDGSVEDAGAVPLSSAGAALAENTSAPVKAEEPSSIAEGPEDAAVAAAAGSAAARAVSTGVVERAGAASTNAGTPARPSSDRAGSRGNGSRPPSLRYAANRHAASVTLAETSKAAATKDQFAKRGLGASTPAVPEGEASDHDADAMLGARGYGIVGDLADNAATGSKFRGTRGTAVTGGPAGLGKAGHLGNVVAGDTGVVGGFRGVYGRGAAVPVMTEHGLIYVAPNAYIPSQQVHHHHYIEVAPQTPPVPWGFKRVTQQPLSTFSVDVDTASLSHARRYLTSRRRVPHNLVRVEEIINAFHYDDPPPENDAPFAVKVEVSTAPWDPANQLVRVALTTHPVQAGDRPAANLVFLIDTSGSMKSRRKLPLLVKGLTKLVEALRDDDRVAIVTYARRSKIVLEPTVAADKAVILRALRRLKAGGTTNGGAGLDMAYDLARRHFSKGGSNRVILATDGEFNAGQTSVWQLQRLIKDKARSGVMLSVLGFGIRGYDDQRLEALSHHGNGRYAYIDSLDEAQRVLVRELDATLVTAAKDVRIQVELNPTYAHAYRLIGYANRGMAAQDFNREGKDAGDLGAGESVVAFYEVIPTTATTLPAVDALRYQPSMGTADASPTPEAPGDETGELMLVKVRWVPPAGGPSERLDVPVPNETTALGDVSPDYALSAAAAAFGLKLQAGGDPRRQISWSMVRALLARSAERGSVEATVDRKVLGDLVDAAVRIYGGP